MAAVRTCERHIDVTDFAAQIGVFEGREIKTIFAGA